MTQESETVVESFDPKNHPTMVSRLFNVDDMEALGAGIIHATVGIAGEVHELAMAIDEKNWNEEAGDLEFYFMAADEQVQMLTEKFEHNDQVMQMQAVTMSRDKLAQLRGSLPEDITRCTPEQIEVLYALLRCAAMEMLDRAKRVWVYKNHTATNLIELIGNLNIAYWTLRTLYVARGVTLEGILVGNMIKLIGEKGRYKGMIFTHDAANARADKAEDGNVQEA